MTRVCEAIPTFRYQECSRTLLRKGNNWAAIGGWPRIYSREVDRTGAIEMSRKGAPREKEQEAGAGAGQGAEGQEREQEQEQEA